MIPTLKQETDDTYAHTLRLIEAITPEQATQPGACGEWSACDVVAHFTGWHPEGQAQLQSLLDDTYERKRYDFDQFNAESVAVRKHMTWEELVEEFKQSHAAFVAFADPIEDALWDNKRVHGWFVSVTSHHYPQHYEHLEKAATF
jgi:uncharacterized protein (TIGR03083 family)